MTSSTSVRRSNLPRASRIADRFRGATLADSYAVRLLPDAGGIDAIAERALGHPGPVFRTALAIRDTLMSPFGVKTSDQIRAELTARDADRIDFFPVLSRSPTEIILGEDDRHLDFRLSLLLREASDKRELVATTVVHCHGLLGGAYLAAIMAGHVLVVQSVLAKAAASEQGVRHASQRTFP